MLITKENCPARWSAAAERLIDGRKSELEMLHVGDQEVYTQVYNLDVDSDSIPYPIVKMLGADATGATFSVSPTGSGIVWKADKEIKTWDGTAPAVPTPSTSYTPGTKVEYSGGAGKHVVVAFTVEDSNGVSDRVSFTKIYAPAVPEITSVSETGLVTFTSEGGAPTIEYTITKNTITGSTVTIMEDSPYQIPGLSNGDVVEVRVKATNPAGSSEWTDAVQQTIA